MKYAVFPDFVRSRTDGDMHFIDARHLMQLYQVNPDECLVVDDRKTTRSNYARLIRQVEEMNLIHLRPRFDGNYTL